MPLTSSTLSPLRLKLDGLPFVTPQQRVHRHRVRAIVLVQDAQQPPSAGIAQHHRLRLQLRRGSGELELIQALFQVEWNGFAHDGELLVVDGEGGVGGEAGGNENRETVTRNRMDDLFRLDAGDTGKVEHVGYRR